MYRLYSYVQAFADLVLAIVTQSPMQTELFFIVAPQWSL